jgi:hypothetical protein
MKTTRTGEGSRYLGADLTDRFHAMSDDANRLYARAGFHECPVDPMMMMITLTEVEKNLSPPSAS